MTDIALEHQHKWGFPFYILGSSIQNSNTPGLTKWYPHSHYGICIGCSSSYASLVALIRNQLTGHVSNKYHVIFNDDFWAFHSYSKVQFHQIKWNYYNKDCRRVNQKLPTSGTLGLIPNSKIIPVKFQTTNLGSHKNTQIHLLPHIQHKNSCTTTSQ